MPKLKVNGQEVEFENGMTIMQVCELAGEEVPRFCYHEKLSIAGNCRMCLVEMEKSPKPVASCAMPAAENMVIHTNTPSVKKAREGVMEFLLINHPLDCPICDQGGECDLQDQAMLYGKANNRFHENKRAVKDKNMGPLIKTTMTRCIHCTRCVRYVTDIAGVPDIGAVGRGEHMEITTYLEKAVSSEVSGNAIDLCPVGALTSKPYAYKARSWELKKTESIDISDAVGSNIRIDSRGMEVMRILPRVNEEINEEWISDKTRFMYDGLKYQRLDQPMVRIDGKLQRTTWEVALSEIKKIFTSNMPSDISILIGKTVDTETICSLKILAEDMQIKDLIVAGNIRANKDNAMSYMFNTTIAGIEKSDLCLLVGANPRYDASMVNLRIRKRYLKGNYKIASIGITDDQTYLVNHLGDSIKILDDIIAGKSEFCSDLEKSKYPIIIVGDSLLYHEDSMAIQYKLNQICKKYNIIRSDWNGYNILHKYSAAISSLLMGIDYKKNYIDILSSSKVLYLVDEDDVDLSNISKDSVVIYQGHHGDKNAHRADIILPSSAYTEKSSTYVNLEGRVQRTKQAVKAPNVAKHDYEIIIDIAKILGRNYFNDIYAIRDKMASINPIFSKLGLSKKNDIMDFGIEGDVRDFSPDTRCKDFYLTDSICRASKIMAECSRIFSAKQIKEGDAA